jgi:hypothetical protein
MQLAIGLMKTGAYDGPRLKVLVYLAWKHDWRSGFAWPSMARIASETGIEERSVRRIMHYLEESGVIRLSRGNGAGHLTRYEFPQLAEPVAAAGVVSEEKGDISTVKGDAASDEGGRGEQQRGTFATEKGDAGEGAIRKEKQDQKQQQKPMMEKLVSESSNGADDDTKLNFVLQAFEESPVTKDKAGPSDRAIARELLKVFSPEQIEYGILLATARRMTTEHFEHSLAKVQSLAYFANAIEEASADPNCSASYAQYLRHLVQRREGVAPLSPLQKVRATG